MAVFTAIAAAVVSAIGITGTAATIFTAIGATVLSVGVSSLIAKRMQKSAMSGLGAGQGGGRVQLPPATDNKIPVVYGSGYVSGPVIDAKLSTDQQYMWYVVALAEVTDTGSYTYDTSNIYYDGKKVQFGTNGNVTGLINNTTPATIDTKVSGKIKIWLFTNGSSSGVNTGGQTAIQILQDSTTGGGIPAGQRWTSTDTMTDCAFAIIRVEYNTDAGTTSLGALQARITNSLDKPGDVIFDYLNNDRYGCAVPASRIDTASLTALNNYSDEIINYGTGTQARYRINGPLATSITCLENLQILVDSCDSWLQYNELNAKWSVVINQSYTDYTTIGDLFLVDSDNLIGGINVAPINLNETFNQMEVAYPNQYIRDQIDYQVIELEDYAVGVMSPNEAVNKLDIDFPVINNSVQALYVGVRRLLQSREDLTITCKLDYSGIQIEAGDVIRVQQEVYGWDVLNGGYGKLFRVATVAEEKYQDGSLGVSITAFEYNDTIYADRALLDFQPDPNTGLQDPNIIDQPEKPRIYVNEYGSIPVMEVTGAVPDTGLVNYFDFQYGNTSNTDSHIFYASRSNANGAPLNSTLTSDLFAVGQKYSILTLGTTNWQSAGTITEVDLSLAPQVPGGQLIIGRRYIIVSVGTTNFTSWGAVNNVVGEIFTAVGIGDGTGVVYETDFVCTAPVVGTGTAQTIYSIDVTELPTGIYYWSVKARNDQVGITSNASFAVPWSGSNITQFISNTYCNATSNGNVITFSPSSENIIGQEGGNVTITAGTGAFAANTYIANVLTNTTFIVEPAPTVALSNACVEVTNLDPNSGNAGGGVDGNTIQDGTINFNKFGNSIYAAANIGGYSFQTSDAANNFTYNPVDATTFGNIIGSNTATPKYLANVQYSGSTLDPYPFYQQSSSTLDGYLANSNPFFDFFPAYAAQLNFYNGFKDWWVMEYVDYNGVRIPEGEEVLIEYSAQYVSNVDCTIQFAQFTTSAIAPDLNKLFIDSESFDTINLKANEPKRLDLERTTAVNLSGGNTYAYGGGYVARQLTSGANTICVQGTITAYRTKGR